MDFINRIRGGKFVVSESIIANHACASQFVGKKICGFLLTTKSVKILPLKNFPLYGI